MTRFTPTERIGVNVIENIFLEEFEWIPRHIFQSDVGIDMEVEICEDGNPTGQLFGVQIKTGESYFKENVVGDIIYRGTNIHLDYWTNHSLPIVIILHNPKTKQTIWQKIDEEKITRTPKNWKIEIPLTQTLSSKFIDDFKDFNKYPIYFQRLQRLLTQKKLIEAISKGEKIVLELDQWINKTIGRVEIRIKKVFNIDNEIVLSESGYIHFSGIQDLSVLYPWADISVDEEYYDDYDNDTFLENYGIWDPESKEYIGSSIDYQEYAMNLPKIRPMETGSGEIHHYRLELTLNNLGQSFIEMNSFLEKGIQLKLNI